MWCYEHHAEFTAMELQRDDVATLCGWMLLLDRQHLKVILRELLHDQVILRELLHDQVILAICTESRYDKVLKIVSSWLKDKDIEARLVY
ncbi:hypothetical protein Tco_0582807 [Tanacetum coccineum]